MRSLGFDLGTKNLGVAISDNLGLIANPLETLKFASTTGLIDPVSKLLEEYEVDAIALGLPKNMDGSEGFAAERSLKFKELLEANFDVKIVLVDERLSTVEAEKYLLDADMSRKKRKSHIDAVAASVILNTYLRMKGKENE
ncbi:MAG TPA: Holliday junction resolvase RuvX [Firmicutes bacterium]|nr:Holliday junction resolvase RuvX [Bacillota bacterium]